MILLNSHDGSSSYQMIPGMFREHTRDHLITGRSIMRVKKNDFGYFCSFIGPFTAKSYHMLSMPPFILIPYS
ncbi:hypothetical protein [Klebsiella pneumoniae]